MGNKLIEIYSKTKSNQTLEPAFAQWLKKSIPNSVIIRDNYVLQENLKFKSLNTVEITSKIIQSTLPQKKKDKCVEILSHLPKEIRIIKSINRISVDIAIRSQDKVQLIEFHEDQHRINSDKRLKDIYTISGEPIKVPRYMQRLLRDIWRLKHLNNYKIVWYDWFEKNPNIDFLETDIKEFALDGKFRISELV